MLFVSSEPWTAILTFSGVVKIYLLNAVGFLHKYQQHSCELQGHSIRGGSLYHDSVLGLVPLHMLKPLTLFVMVFERGWDSFGNWFRQGGKIFLSSISPLIKE